MRGPGEQATEGEDLELRGSWGTQREDGGCATSMKEPKQNSKLGSVLESVAGDRYRKEVQGKRGDPAGRVSTSGGTERKLLPSGEF